MYAGVGSCTVSMLGNCMDRVGNSTPQDEIHNLDKRHHTSPWDIFNENLLFKMLGLTILVRSY